MSILSWHILCLLVPMINVDGAEGISKIHVDPVTGHFIDSVGRIRMFRGINAVKKSFPWYPSELRSEKRMSDLLDMGMNVVRLGMMWTGWEPNENAFNQTYASISDDIIRNLESRGIYALLDTHQDVLWESDFNGTTFGYWGVPPYIKEKVDVISKPFPWPLLGLKRWECGYLTQEITRGFQSFYNNVNGVADDFARFWKSVAQRFSGRKNILGYELINEPFSGDIYAEPKLLFPGFSGHENLVPFYDKLQRAIRSADEETIVFWEPMVSSTLLPVPAFLDSAAVNILNSLSQSSILSIISFFCGETAANISIGTEDENNLESPKMDSELGRTLTRSQLPSNSRSRMDPPAFGPGLSMPPGGPQFANRSVLSWHHYCPISSTIKKAEGKYNMFKRFFCDYIFAPMVFKQATSDALKVGGGSMLTEFGMCVPNVTNHLSENTLECNAVMEEAEKYFQSWTYWNSESIWNKTTGKLIPEVAKAFARPYPLATMGTPHKLSFDLWRRKFHYSFFIPNKFPTDQKYPTEIAVPLVQYPDGGYSVETSPGLSWKLSPHNPNILQVFYDSQVVKHGKLVHVDIFPIESIGPKGWN